MRSIEELAAEICTLAGHINAAHHRWLVLIAEYDRRNGWADSATQSCAHWLNWKCGIAMGAAREKVRVARAIENLPKVSAAMACGKLSYSKAREITRVASSETEDYLLMIAEHGTAQHVEKLVRAYRRCQDAEELSREARQQQTRCVSYRYDGDGSLVLNCRLPAEAGALILKALELAVDELPADDVPAGTSTELVPFSARRADALALMAESFVAHDVLEAPGTDRHQIVVHVATETLRDRAAGSCEFEHGPSIAAETARRLACDACVVTLIENDDGEPLNVGRKTRNISAPLRRLLKARDKGCRFPGCANARYLDAHHVDHWANGGETKPSNLVSLCRFHHHAVHEGGIRIERLDDGAFRFVKANGAAIDRVAPGFAQPAGDWKQLPAATHSAETRWKGERMDYGLGVEVLLQQARRLQTFPRG
jgi:Domain of unknown function (DUF222)/HNH endonuclease